MTVINVGTSETEVLKLAVNTQVAGTSKLYIVPPLSSVHIGPQLITGLGYAWPAANIDSMEISLQP